jgi:hypothetical protein
VLTLTLSYNVDLTGFSSFCECLVTNGAKDGVQIATPIVITLQRSILYILASFGSHYFPTLSNPCICASFQIQTLSTYVGETNATNSGL